MNHLGTNQPLKIEAAAAWEKRNLPQRLQDLLFGQDFQAWLDGDRWILDLERDWWIIERDGSRYLHFRYANNMVSPILWTALGCFIGWRLGEHPRFPQERWGRARTASKELNMQMRSRWLEHPGEFAGRLRKLLFGTVPHKMDPVQERPGLWRLDMGGHYSVWIPDNGPMQINFEGRDIIADEQWQSLEQIIQWRLG